jgi:integrase
MAQQGSLYAEHGSWFVRYWEEIRRPDGSVMRKHPAHRLASVKDYPKKSEVIPLKNSFMEKLSKIGFTPEAGVSIVDFVEKTFFPACEKRLSGGGTKCYRDSWKCHLRQHVVGFRLRDFRSVDVQTLLNKEETIHDKKLSHGTYKLMKVTLSAIFTEARNLGLYEGVNPTTGVRIPKGKKHGRKRLAYSLEEILKHLDLFKTDRIVVINEDGPYTPEIQPEIVRAIIGVTAFAGLRRGEIRGLWWDDDGKDVLSICRSMWRSTLKNTKTEEDIDEPGLVPIIKPLRLLLDAIKPAHTSGFIFPNTVGGALDLDNLADRVIRPTMKAHGLLWKGWQAYRRGLATNLKELGVPDTTIQCILRHENVDTTRRFYIKTAPKVAKDAMKKLEKKITGTAVVQQVAVN